MAFLDYFRRSPTTASLAKDRLSIIVARERATTRGAPDYLPQLQQELLAVIARYEKIDLQEVGVRIDSSGGCEVLELNIVLPEGQIPPGRAKRGGPPPPGFNARKGESARKRKKGGLPGWDYNRDHDENMDGGGRRRIGRRQRGSVFAGLRAAAPGTLPRAMPFAFKTAGRASLDEAQRAGAGRRGPSRGSSSDSCRPIAPTRTALQKFLDENLADMIKG